MTEQISVADGLANSIVSRVEALLTEAEQETKPLELDPYRGELFELFVTAEAAGFLEDDADPDLTADGIARGLSQRWDLAQATRASLEQQSKLPSEQLSKMRGRN